MPLGVELLLQPCELLLRSTSAAFPTPCGCLCLTQGLTLAQGRAIAAEYEFVLAAAKRRTRVHHASGRPSCVRPGVQ